MFLALAEGSIQLVPDGTLFVHIFLIILMVFILNFTLFRPINQILSERESQTLGRYSETSAILREIEADLKDYEQTLREARARGYSLLENQRAEAMQQRHQLVSKLREELHSSTREEKQLIQEQVEQVRLILSEENRRTASQISRQILHQ